MTGHDHATGNRTRLTVAIAIIASVLVIEVVGAVASGSLALLADVGHMLSDLLALCVALIALTVAARPATDRQTFGYQRAEVLGALLNGLLLIAVAAFVVVEAVTRLLASEAAHPVGIPMIVVAAIGLLGNIAAALVLRSGHSESIGMRAAYLEVLGDLLGSAAALIAGIVIATTGFVQADAIASLMIAALIVPRAISLLRDVIRVLFESAPKHMDVAAIRTHLLDTAGVVDVHDVHVWAITSGNPVFSAHVVVSPELFESGQTGSMLAELGRCLSGHFDVEHSTFQLEPADHATHEETTHR
jgi:cobalt-zinc-cadmium efflux system protein